MPALTLDGSVVVDITVQTPPSVSFVQGNVASAEIYVPGPQGPKGDKGTVWLSGVGVPAGTLGRIGDWYLNTDNGDVYEKTGELTWTLRDNLTGRAATDTAQTWTRPQTFAMALGADVPITVRSHLDGTADLQRWTNNAGTILTRIGPTGIIFTDRIQGQTSDMLIVQPRLEPAVATGVGLKVRGLASQSGSLQEWQNSAGVVLSRIDQFGNLNFPTDNTFGAATKTQAFTGKAIFSAGAATNVPIVSRADAAQTADLQQWQNSAGAVLSKITSGGGMTIYSGGAGLSTFYNAAGSMELGTEANAALRLNTFSGGEVQVGMGSSANFRVNNTSNLNHLNVSGTTNFTSAPGGLGFVSYAERLRANHNISGGGTISISGAGDIRWTSRFVVVSNGRGTHFSTNGYYDINMPADGTVITGGGGIANQTVVAGGIPMPAWSALYYILPIGTTNGSVNANFRIVGYTADLEVPSEWVLLAVRNSDTNTTWVNAAKVSLNYGDSHTAAFGTGRSQFVTLRDTQTVTGGKNFNGGISVGTDPVVNAWFAVGIKAATNMGAVIRGAGSQTADLQQWQNSAGTPLAGVNANGHLYANGFTGGSSSNLGYAHATLELYESGFSPRLSFHWGGTVASQIAIESNGTIAIRNNPGTSYEKFRASHVTVGQGNLSQIDFVNPGVGGVQEFRFLRASDSAGMRVTEPVSDNILYRFYMSDNPDGGDFFSWYYTDWQGGNWEPIRIGGMQSTFISPTTTNYGNTYFVDSPYYTGNEGTPNQVTKTGTGTLTATPGVLGYTGVTTVYWARIDGTPLSAPSGLAAAAVADATSTLAAATYYYVVSAVNSTGQTTVSNEASAVIAAGQRADLSWTAPTGTSVSAITYNIHRSTTAGSGWVVIATGVTTTTYSDLGAAATTTAAPTANTTKNSFRWGTGGSGSAPVATGITVTGGAQALNNGVTLTFNATTGGVVNDQYIFRANRGGLVRAGRIEATKDVLTDGFMYEKGKRVAGRWGQHENHGVFTDFNSTAMDFGAQFVTGTANGPAIPGATQYYNMNLSLGANYPMQGATGSYAMQFAIPRNNPANAYPAVRWKENGTWTAWVRIKAGYADTAGTATPNNDANLVHKDGTETITGAKTFSLTPIVPDASFGVAKLSATGTRDATTFLRGDNTWATINISNMVTTDTAQTISGAKTFTATIVASNGFHVNGNGAAFPAAADSYMAARTIGNRPLVIQAFTGGGQTAALTQWLGAGGNVLASITAAGDISTGGYIAASGRGAIGPNAGSIGPQLSVFNSTATQVAEVIRGAASQSADLMQFQDSAGNVLARVANDGTIYKGSTAVGGNAADTEIMAIMGAF